MIKKPRGRALTLSCGRQSLRSSGPTNIHITLVFFHNLYEPIESKVKEIAIEWLKANYSSNQINITLGENWGKRSFLVTGEIINLQKRLIKHFQDMGYQMDTSDRSFTPHVDLRGHPRSVLLDKINLIESLSF